METTVTIPLSDFKLFEKMDAELSAKEALCIKLKYELENKNTYTVKIDTKQYGYQGGIRYVTLDEYKFDVADNIKTLESAIFRGWLLEKENGLKALVESARNEMQKSDEIRNKLKSLPSFVKWLFKIKL